MISRTALPLRLIFLILGGCATSIQPTVLYVPLEAPTNDEAKSGVAPISSGANLYIETVFDERQDRATIGVNGENDAKVPVVAVQLSPADYLGQLTAISLMHEGVTLTTTPERADHFLRIRLQRFFTVEENTYRTEVTAIAEVRDRSGNIAFSGMVTGTARRFGHSLSPDNYRSSIASAVHDFADNLYKEKGFEAAIADHPAPPPPPIAPVLPPAAPTTQTPRPEDTDRPSAFHEAANAVGRDLKAAVKAIIP